MVASVVLAIDRSATSMPYFVVNKSIPSESGGSAWSPSSSRLSSPKPNESSASLDSGVLAPSVYKDAAKALSASETGTSPSSESVAG